MKMQRERPALGAHTAPVLPALADSRGGDNVAFHEPAVQQAMSSNRGGEIPDMGRRA